MKDTHEHLPKSWTIDARERERERGYRDITITLVKSKLRVGEIHLGVLCVTHGLAGFNGHTESQGERARERESSRSKQLSHKLSRRRVKLSERQARFESEREKEREERGRELGGGTNE